VIKLHKLFDLARRH